MKKIIAVLLALAMVFALAACGSSSAPAKTEEPKTEATEAPKAEEPKAEEPKAEEPKEEPKAEEPAPVDTSDPDSIPDSVNSADGTFEIAFRP